MAHPVLSFNYLDDRSGNPGAYSMTLMVEVADAEHPHGGVAAYRRGAIPGWLTLRAKGLEGEGMRDADSIDLVADFNQQEGSPLRVMLGKQWTHWVAGPEGLVKSGVEKILPSMSVEFHPGREVWGDDEAGIRLVVIARRNPANRSTSISLPRFAIRKLLDIEHKLGEVHCVLEFEPPVIGYHEGSLGNFGNPCICRFDRRRSTLKPINLEGASWAEWYEPNQYNLESLQATMRLMENVPTR